MQRLMVSGGKYELPLEPAGADDWDTMLLEEPTPDTHRDNDQAKPT
ncbi:hypothetical protein [Vreelandella nanhaiensis]|nr:hypothetical protein [Halomonas nanhaiensis]